VNHLVMQYHPDYPMQSLVYMQDDKGNQTNATSLLTNGKLHGLLDIKDSFIPQVLGDLDRLAAHLTSRVNQQHSVGFGLDGTTGHDFFTPRQVSGQGLASNAGGGELQSVAILDPTQLPLDDLRIRFVSDGPPPQLDIVNDATGEVVVSGQTYVSGAPLVFAGIEVVLSDSGGLPQSGDTFVIHTTAGSAQRLEVNPTLQNDARQIAAAQTDSPGDNANARSLANLEDEPLLDGFAMGDFYSALLTGVGATGQLTTGLAEQQQLLLTEVENRRESISGVSLEEEQIDLIRFQQAFAAADQLINIADELAQTVLNMAG
jgi:flagellar hook-associated protein 1 FlgK